jgi:putative addiction module component (TIGR02574 family)
VIDSALALNADQRLAVFDAIHASLADPTIDHGPTQPVELAVAAWKDEIAQRIADIDAGRVQTVPAEQAERMIRGAGQPSV